MLITRYLHGTIKKMGTLDTCDVDILGVLGGLNVPKTYSAVPIFYHCSSNVELRDNGALYGAAGAFRIDDKVIVYAQRVPGSADYINLKVVGFDMQPKRACGFQVRITREYDLKVLTDAVEDGVEVALYYSDIRYNTIAAAPITLTYDSKSKIFTVVFDPDFLKISDGVPLDTNNNPVLLYDYILGHGGFWLRAGGSKALTMQWPLVLYREDANKDADKVLPGFYEFLIPYRAMTQKYNPGMGFVSLDFVSPWIDLAQAGNWNGRSDWPVWWKSYGIEYGNYDEDWWVEIPWPSPYPVYQYSPYTMFSVTTLSLEYTAICTASHRIKETYNCSASGYADYARVTLPSPYTECRDEHGGTGFPQTCWDFHWRIDPTAGLYPNKCGGSVVSSGGMNLTWAAGNVPSNQTQWSNSDTGSITLNITPITGGWTVIQGYTLLGASLEPPSGKTWL